MSEWLKEPVLKTGDGSAVRGFESRSLLHLKFNIGTAYNTNCGLERQQLIYLYAFSIRRSTQEAEEAPLLRV